MNRRNFVLSGLPALLLPGAGMGQTARPAQVSQASSLRMMSSRELRSLINQRPPPPVVVAYFTEQQCPPCTRMTPSIQALAAEFADRLVFVHVDDIGENLELVQRWEIAELPTLLVLKDGRLTRRRTGFASRDDIRAWITSVVR